MLWQDKTGLVSGQTWRWCGALFGLELDRDRSGRQSCRGLNRPLFRRQNPGEWNCSWLGSSWWLQDWSDYVGQAFVIVIGCWDARYGHWLNLLLIAFFQSLIDYTGRWEAHPSMTPHKRGHCYLPLDRLPCLIHSFRKQRKKTNTPQGVTWY